MNLRIRVEGVAYDVQVDVLPDQPSIVEELEMPAELSRPPHPSDVIPDDRICRSPIAGTVVSVAVAPGHPVRRDDPIAIIEAMKMQTAIGAPVAGVVEQVAVRPGDAVKAGQILCRLG